jgi:DNA-binding transcriptional LysR family regulator
MALADHLDKIRAFEVIATVSTMREAAAKLNVTQPSLTRLVQTLEEALGETLLVRSRAGVQPTEAGKLLLAYTRETLKRLEDFEQKVRTPADQLAGHLRIGSYASLAEYLWPDFIVSMQKSAPSLKISIRTAEIASDQRALENGEIDILVDAEPRLSGDFTSWKLYEDRFNFYAKKPLKEPLTPENFGSTTLIYSPVAFDEDNRKIDQHLEEQGYRFREKIQLDSFTSVLAFCRRGVGIGVLPQRLAAEAMESNAIIQVALRKFPQRGFGTHNLMATIRSDREGDPRVRFLIKSLRQWFKD